MSEAALYERELHAVITVAWYAAQPQGAVLNEVLRPYAFGRGSATSVQDIEKHVDRERVAAICALLVCSQPWDLGGLKKVTDTQGFSRVPKPEFDPVCASWYPLASPSLLGIHFWELSSRIIELKRLSKFDKPPALQFGPFGAQRPGREDSAMGRAHELDR